MRFSDLFICSSRPKIAVLGDFLLDVYTIGKAKRISPEAPVAVLHVEREEMKAGGAGNVCVNLESLGADVVSIGRVGDDLAGRELQSMLKGSLLVQKGFATPKKNRMVSDDQQIVRVDHETVLPLDRALEEKLIRELPKLLADVSIVAVSDYGKGFVTHALFQRLISLSKELDFQVIVDPKGADFSKYFGATVIKPNLGEAYAASSLDLGAPLEDVAEKLLEFAKVVLITRSGEGLSLFQGKDQTHYPAAVREVKDVTGAGDTVLAVFCFALARKLTLHEAASLANVAGGLSVEHVGCAKLTLGEIARQLLRENLVDKVIDGAHKDVLLAAMQDKECHSLHLKEPFGIDAKTFYALSGVGREGKDLLLHVSPDLATKERLDWLSSLAFVRWIVVGEQSAL